MKVLDGLPPDPPKGWYWKIRADRKRTEVVVHLMPHSWRFSGMHEFVSARKEVYRDYNYRWEMLSQRELAQVITQAAEILLRKHPEYIKKLADEKQARAVVRKNRKNVKAMTGVYR